MVPNKPIAIEDILTPDAIAKQIADMWLTWDQNREPRKLEWDEIQRFIFATDTTKTSNARNPWANKTVIPKMCQIRDNLYANYMATLFPQRKWLIWEGETEQDNSQELKDNIVDYMQWVIDRNEFYDEFSKFVLDYLDYGNIFGTVDWKDKSFKADPTSQDKYGYVGPVPVRISPLDIVFDPTCASFEDAPKIVRSIVSLGEVKDILLKLAPTSSEDPEYQGHQDLYDYMMEVRQRASVNAFESDGKDTIYQVAGYGSFRDYLLSGSVEILTFYGDIFSPETGEYRRNRIVKVVDRHKVISDIENPSLFGKDVIFHVGWRTRPDNLWAMGPFDNLVGMQYRIDHLENIKADMFDITAMPPVLIRGEVEPFKWAPFEQIIAGDNGSVEVLKIDTAALGADTQIALYEKRMEEMAGSPKESMGFRTPGEKTMYEVQRLELAAGRIYQSKSFQLERQLTERLLNAMLELARRKMNTVTIKFFDSDFNVAAFKDVSAQDITGAGRLRPVAARHFAERANTIQNLTQFFSSSIGADPLVRNHFSSIKIAKMMEELLDIGSYELILENVRIAEQAQAQKMINSSTEQVAMESMTPGGIIEGDHDAQITG